MKLIPKYQSPAQPIIDGGTLDEVVVTPPQRYILLNTYYPGSETYPYTGHSELITPYGTISRRWNDRTYNLLNNNCSDATLNALNYVFGTSEQPLFFTTPGDVRDYAKAYLKAVDGSQYDYFRLDGTTALRDPFKIPKGPKSLVKRYLKLQKRREAKKQEQHSILIPVTTEQLKKVHEAFLINRRAGHYKK